MILGAEKTRAAAFNMARRTHQAIAHGATRGGERQGRKKIRSPPLFVRSRGGCRFSLERLCGCVLAPVTHRHANERARRQTGRVASERTDAASLVQPAPRSYTVPLGQWHEPLPAARRCMSVGAAFDGARCRRRNQSTDLVTNSLEYWYWYCMY